MSAEFVRHSISFTSCHFNFFSGISFTNKFSVQTFNILLFLASTVYCIIIIDQVHCFAGNHNSGFSLNIYRNALPKKYRINPHTNSFNFGRTVLSYNCKLFRYNKWINSRTAKLQLQIVYTSRMFIIMQDKFAYYFKFFTNNAVPNIPIQIK